MVNCWYHHIFHPPWTLQCNKHLTLCTHFQDNSYLSMMSWLVHPSTKFPQVPVDIPETYSNNHPNQKGSECYSIAGRIFRPHKTPSGEDREDFAINNHWWLNHWCCVQQSSKSNQNTNWNHFHHHSNLRDQNGILRYWFHHRIFGHQSNPNWRNNQRSLTLQALRSCPLCRYWNFLFETGEKQSWQL